MAELRVTSTGTIKLFESDDTSSVTIASPASLGGDRTITLPDANVDLTEVNTMPIANLDIDGGTDIGAAITDSDLFIIDDGAGGTNRKTAASRIKTYVGGFDVTSITGATELAETPADTDEFIISDAGTLKRVDFSHIKSSNTPSFRAGLANSPTLGTGADTFITFDNEIFDTDNAHDTSNGRFTVPTGKAGKYFFSAKIRSVSSADFNQFEVHIFQNTTSIAEARHYHDDYGSVQVNVLVDASEGDYFRVRGMQNAGSDKTLYEHQRFCYFEGFKLA